MTDFKCDRCGWCCLHLAIPIFNSRFIKSEREWHEARNIQIKNGKMIIYSPCKYLTFENTEKKIFAVCSIQDDKPIKCRIAGCNKID